MFHERRRLCDLQGRVDSGYLMRQIERANHEAGADHRRHAATDEESARLPIERIAPSMAMCGRCGESMQIVHKSLRFGERTVAPSGQRCQSAGCHEPQRHGFRVAQRRHAKQRPQIDRRALEPLDQRQSAGARAQQPSRRRTLHHQPVVRIPTLPIALDAVGPESLERRGGRRCAHDRGGSVTSTGRRVVQLSIVAKVQIVVSAWLCKEIAGCPDLIDAKKAAISSA